MSIKFTSALAAALIGLGSAYAAEKTITVGNWELTCDIFEDKGLSVNKAVASQKSDLDLTEYNGTNGKDAIFNIRPGVFRENTDLTGLKLPSTLQTFTPMTTDDFFSEHMTGENDPGADANAGKTKTYNLATPIPANTSFTMNVEVAFENWTIDNKNQFLGDWGSALLATGTKPTEDYYYTGFQLWINSSTNTATGQQGQVLFKFGNSSVGHNISPVSYYSTCGGHITIKIDYNAETKVVSATVGDTHSTFSDVTFSKIDVLCNNIKEGVTVDANVTMPSTEDLDAIDPNNPFKGCTSLMYFEVDEANTIFTVGPNGALRKNGEVKAYPYGKLFNKLVRIKGADGNYVQSAMKVDAQGKLLAGDYDQRQLGYGPDKSGASLFNFRLFGPDDTWPGAFLNGVNASAAGSGDTWVGGPGSHNRVDEICIPSSGRQWAGRMGLSVVPGEALVQFYMTVTDKNGTTTKNVAVQDGKLITTTEKGTPFTIEFAEDIVVPVSDGYGSACLPVAVVNDVTAGVISTVTSVTDENGVQLTAIETPSIAAKTPFIVKSTEPVTLKIATEVPADATEPAASLLKGFTCACTALTAADSYALTNSNFTQTTSTGANSAYIAKPADATWNNTLSIYSKVNTSSITEIGGAAGSAPAAIYDLRGRRLAAPVKGINIINGRKVLVK